VQEDRGRYPTKAGHAPGRPLSIIIAACVIERAEPIDFPGWRKLKKAENRYLLKFLGNLRRTASAVSMNRIEEV